jgi:small subunit ribosomal protein S6e
MNMAMKIVISEPKTKKAYQVEKDAPGLIGVKIGDKFDGGIVGLSGFTLELTGGSDKAGFPMRADLDGIARRKALLTKGVGFRGTKKIKKKTFKVKGLRRRKYIRGNKISDEIAQVNCKVVEGDGDIAMMLGLKKEEAPAEGEAPKEEAPVTEEKAVEQPKEETKPEEKPAEEPKEEKKE